MTADGITAAITAAVTAAMAQGGMGGAGGGGGGEVFAPKHGVRLLRSALDVAMVVPLLQGEAAVAIDLEGELTPGEGQGVDLLQLYLPSLDLVLLVHAVRPSAARNPRPAAHRGICCPRVGHPWRDRPR